MKNGLPTVLHINISDRLGGAAIAAFRLHRAMREAGIDSRYFALNRVITDDEYIITASRFERHVSAVINRVLENLAGKPMRNRAGLFSPFRFGLNIARRSAIAEAAASADIIYLHWICGGLLDIRGLKTILKTGKPVFWFMHDMFPITGGCHYAFDCAAYETNCEHCPCAAARRRRFSLASRQFRRKRLVFRRFDNLAFIAPSRWLFDCAKRSALTKDKRIEHIPNLIDGAVFKPLDKETARRLFGASAARNARTRSIGFGADAALTNPYKGWEYLVEALNLLKQDESMRDAPIELLIFGSSYNEAIAKTIPFKAHFLGRLSDEYSLAMTYNAMDVFVIPSTAENFPNTVLESLACGTPVVGFDTGGIPDMVSRETGYLAEYKNSADLARGIALTLKNPKTGVREQVKKFFAEKVLTQHEKLIPLPPPPPPPRNRWLSWAGGQRLNSAEHRARRRAA
ncbi:MAG: glycosyltransferase family 4 [Treponematales bacterium]